MRGAAHFQVWLAADAFLYLPIYALERFGILQRVAEANNWQDVTIEIKSPPAPGEGFDYERGDDGAARKMLWESENNRSAVQLSVGDPIQALRPLSPQDVLKIAPKSDPSAYQNLRVIASLIKKPPFWLVGNSSINGLVDDGDKLFFYEENLGTGHELGLKLVDAMGFKRKFWECPNSVLGDELDPLFSGNKANHRAVILTADVMGVARSWYKSLRDELNYENLVEPTPVSSVLKIDAFLTTGICVHKWATQNQRRQLLIFLKALSVSCAMFATSKSAVADLSRSLSSDDRFKNQFILDDADKDRERPRKAHWVRPRLEPEPASWLGESMVREATYNPDLTFSFADWRGSIAAIGDQSLSKFKTAIEGQASRKFLQRRYLFNVDLSLATIVARVPGLKLPDDEPKRMWRLWFVWPTAGFAATLGLTATHMTGASRFDLAILVLLLLTSSILFGPVFRAIKTKLSLFIFGNMDWRNGILIGGILLILAIVSISAVLIFSQEDKSLASNVAEFSLAFFSSIGIVFGSYVAQFIPGRDHDPS